MKTLIIYELVPEETKFFVVDGDRRELNGCIINTIEDAKFSDEVRKEVGEGDTSDSKWGAPIETPVDVVALGVSYVVHCGFML